MNDTVCGSIDPETKCTVSPALIQIFLGPYAMVWMAPERDSEPTMTFQVWALVVAAAWALLASSAGSAASNKANTARNTEDLLGRADIGDMLSPSQVGNVPLSSGHRCAATESCRCIDHLPGPFLRTLRARPRDGVRRSALRRQAADRRTCATHSKRQIAHLSPGPTRASLNDHPSSRSQVSGLETRGTGLTATPPSNQDGARRCSAGRRVVETHDVALAVLEPGSAAHPLHRGNVA